MPTDAEPAPPVIPGLRPPENALDPAVRRIWAVERLLSGLLLTGLAALAASLLAEFTSLPAPLLAAAVGLALVGTIVAAISIPGISYRHYRWEVTEAGLVVQRGWLLREFIAVPHTRVQTVETRRGPLERMVNLASAGVSTAAGEAVRIPGLSAATAAELQAELSARTGRGEGA